MTVGLLKFFTLLGLVMFNVSVAWAQHRYSTEDYQGSSTGVALIVLAIFLILLFAGKGGFIKAFWRSTRWIFIILGLLSFGALIGKEIAGSLGSLVGGIVGFALGSWWVNIKRVPSEKSKSQHELGEGIKKTEHSNRAVGKSAILILFGLVVAAPLITFLREPTHDESTQASFHAMDVTGADWGHTYSLPDLNGQRRTPKDFQGTVTAVFFGFLYCPDACPNHLTKMVALRERLGEESNNLQVVFITVDPERDSPKALKKFLASFDESFIGLRGSKTETNLTAKNFRVYFKKVSGLKAKENPNSYTIDHSLFTYIFDTTGRLRLVVPVDLPLELVASDVRRLLVEARE